MGCGKGKRGLTSAFKSGFSQGNVGFVDSHPLVDGKGSSGSHYGHDAKTYMNVGEGMGEAMVKLLKSQ